MKRIDYDVSYVVPLIMKLNNLYKEGIIKLAILLGLLCFFIVINNMILWAESEPGFVVNIEAQCQIDNQKAIITSAERKKKKSYYVNNLSDFEGYQLGLTPSQLNKLVQFKKTGKSIYSISEFQKITQISTAQLNNIENQLIVANPVTKLENKQIRGVSKKQLENKFFDINEISEKELREQFKLPVFLAKRIVKFRTYLKGYRSMSQLEDVYGISSFQIDLLNKSCRLKKVSLKKYELNKLSAYELSKIPYLSFSISKKIVNFIKNNGEIHSFNDFNKIQGFPVDKIPRLPLYLSL